MQESTVRQYRGSGKRVSRLGQTDAERQRQVARLKELINSGRYDVETRFEAIFDDFVRDALASE